MPSQGSLVELGLVPLGQVRSSLVLSGQSCWVWLRSVKLRRVMLSQVMALHLPPFTRSLSLFTMSHNAETCFEF